MRAEVAAMASQRSVGSSFFQPRLDRRLEAAHGHQDAGVMRGRRGGLDHLAEAALGVGAGEAGDVSTTLVQQGDMGHEDVPSFRLLGSLTQTDRARQV